MDIKLADTKTIKDIAGILFYPMTGISFMILKSPSLQWWWDTDGAQLSSQVLFFRFLLSFIYHFTIASLVITLIKELAVFFLIDIGGSWVILIAGWFFVSLGLLGLFTVSYFPALNYLPQFTYITLLVWGICAITRYEAIPIKAR